MKKTLEFNLPDESRESLAAEKGTNMACFIFDFEQWVRCEIKYREKDYEDVLNLFIQLKESYNIDLSELIE